MRHVAGAALLGLTVAACAFWDGRAAPEMNRPGPLLVAEVVNRSDRDVLFGYEYEADEGSTEGSGEGLMRACSVTTESWAELTGTYRILVGDEVVHEGHLAPGQGNGANLVVRVQIGPDGKVAAAPPVLLAAAPPLGFRELAGC